MSDNKTETPSPQKKSLSLVKKVGLGSVAALMGVTMGYDYIAPLMASTPATVPSHSLDRALFESDLPQSVEVEKVEVSPHALLNPLPKQRPLPEPLPIMASTPTLVVNAKLVLPKTTQRAIQALEATYQSGIQDEANQAKLKEKTSRQDLALFSAPPRPIQVKKQVESRAPTPQMQADALQLKSIVLGASHRSAWFALEDELFPVKVGAWVGDLKVHRLEKTHVLLLDKSGKEYMKYVKTAAPIALERDDES